MELNVERPCRYYVGDHVLVTERYGEPQLRATVEYVLNDVPLLNVHAPGPYLRVYPVDRLALDPYSLLLGYRMNSSPNNKKRKAEDEQTAEVDTTGKFIEQLDSHIDAKTPIEVTITQQPAFSALLVMFQRSHESRRITISITPITNPSNQTKWITAQGCRCQIPPEQSVFRFHELGLTGRFVYRSEVTGTGDCVHMHPFELRLSLQNNSRDRRRIAIPADVFPAPVWTLILDYADELVVSPGFGPRYKDLD
jgi:hypothetical protein